MSIAQHLNTNKLLFLFCISTGVLIQSVMHYYKDSPSQTTQEAKQVSIDLGSFNRTPGKTSLLVLLQTVNQSSSENLSSKLQASTDSMRVLQNEIISQTIELAEDDTAIRKKPEDKRHITLQPLFLEKEGDAPYIRLSSHAHPFRW